jgi:hypothetical protein
MTTIQFAIEQPHRPRRRYGQQFLALSVVEALRRVLNIVIALT